MTSHSCVSSAPCTILLILLVSPSGCWLYHLHTGPQASPTQQGVYCVLTHTLFCIPFSVWPFPGSHSPGSTIPYISLLLNSGLPMPSLSTEGTERVESRGKEAGRTASTELSKGAVGKLLAPLSARPLLAHHRPGPSPSVQHTKNVNNNLFPFAPPQSNLELYSHE